jgi:hypothetical protein
VDPHVKVVVLNDEVLRPSGPRQLKAVTIATATEYGENIDDAVLGPVVTAEIAARRSWADLVAAWPGTEGTRSRIELVSQRFERSIEGPTCRLARAARHQRKPWYLDEDPLRSALLECERHISLSEQLCATIERSRELRERLAMLRGRYADQLPTAWRNMFTSRGVSDSAIDDSGSDEELEAIAYWLTQGEQSMRTWEADVQAWIEQNALSESIERVPSLPTAGLERRYDLLLRLGAIDREPVQRQTAAALRSLVVSHARAAARDLPEANEGPRLQALLDFTTTQVMSEIGVDEYWIYVEAICYYHSRRRK